MVNLQQPRHRLVIITTTKMGILALVTLLELRTFCSSGGGGGGGDGHCNGNFRLFNPRTQCGCSIQLCFNSEDEVTQLPRLSQPRKCRDRRAKLRAAVAFTPRQ